MNKKHIIYLLLLVSVCLPQNSNAQSTTPLKDRLYTGGSFGLTFGTYTNVMISPLLGLMVSDRFYTGVGLEYNYTKDKRYTPALSYNQYGGRIYGQYNFLPNFFTHIEFNGLSFESYTTTLSKTRQFVPFVYVGGGYQQMLSSRSFMSMRVLFDVLQDKNSPYKPWEPIFSVGFGVRL